MEELEREYSLFKRYMKKIEEPTTELFHLDRYIVFDNDENEMGMEIDTDGHNDRNSLKENKFYNIS
jgi:hypothetical protein